MLIIKDQRDLNMLKQRGDIDQAVIRYIEQYFAFFAGEVGEKTSHGLSIEKSSVIVLVEKTDQDLSKLVYLPNILNSIPEEVQQIPITGEQGETRTLLHGLFLTNNEFGVDVIALKDEITGDIRKKFEAEMK